MRLGNITASTPAAFAVRRHAPRLRGSVTPSSTSTSGRAPKLGHAVAGKLFEVNDWNLLDAKEGAPSVYEKIEITVIDENGKTFDAFTYVVTSKNKVEYVKPNQKYVGIVSDGYEEFGILQGLQKKFCVEKSMTFSLWLRNILNSMEKKIVK